MGIQYVIATTLEMARNPKCADGLQLPGIFLPRETKLQRQATNYIQKCELQQTENSHYLMTLIQHNFILLYRS